MRAIVPFVAAALLAAPVPAHAAPVGRATLTLAATGAPVAASSLTLKIDGVALRLRRRESEGPHEARGRHHRRRRRDGDDRAERGDDGDGHWVHVGTGGMTVDLAAGHAAHVIARSPIPPGDYVALRLHVHDAWIVVDGHRLHLGIPGDGGVITLPVRVRVPACGAVRVSLAWNLAADLAHHKNHWWLEAPPAVTAAEVGPPSCCAQVGTPGHITFTPAGVFTAPYDPVEPAVGDFNGDGYPDVVVSGHSAHETKAYLGDGTGALHLSMVSPRFPLQTGVPAVADLDGDGHPDLVVPMGDNLGEPFPDEVEVFLGHGDGTFAPPVGYPTGAVEDVRVAVVDLDGDGIPDLVVADYLGNKIIVLRGLGHGAFGPPVAYDSGGVSPLALLARDFDGDGLVDALVINNSGYGLVLFHGNGDGTLTARPPIRVWTNGPMAAADFDCDGLPDLVLAGYHRARTDVWHNDGGGVFHQIGTLPEPNGAVSVRLMDLNGDGVPDLVVATAFGGIIVRFGLGGGAFGPAETTPVAHQITGMIVGDLNGDGYPDLVVTELHTRMQVFLGGP